MLSILPSPKEIYSVTGIRSKKVNLGGDLPTVRTKYQHKVANQTCIEKVRHKEACLAMI